MSMKGVWMRELDAWIRELKQLKRPFIYLFVSCMVLIGQRLMMDVLFKVRERPE